MKDNKDLKNGYVKKEKLLIVTIIALIAGFLGGVGLTVYKTGADSPLLNPETNQNQITKKVETDSNKTAADILKLEKKTSNNPDDVEAWTELGNLYFDSSSYDKAILAYNRSLKLRPENADVLTDLGVMYQRNGQPAEAVKSFDKAVDIDPRHEVSRFNKGIVLLHDLNDRQGALKAWEELLKLNPEAKTSSGQLVSAMIQQLKN
jgi:cytochrome c-type biogenesis protein CcmH/NrfG